MQAIVNVDENWGIGRDGDQPFYIPEDLAFFKGMTLGKIVIMGRATLNALPGAKPLPKRTNIVLSTKQGFDVEDAVVCASIDELLYAIEPFSPEDIFIIGGGQIYAALLDHCTTAYITKIHANGNCDRFFPNLDKHPDWQLASSSEIKTYNNINFQFCSYTKPKRNSKRNF